MLEGAQRIERVLAGLQNTHAQYHFAALAYQPSALPPALLGSHLVERQVHAFLYDSNFPPFDARMPGELFGRVAGRHDDARRPFHCFEEKRG